MKRLEGYNPAGKPIYSYDSTNDPEYLQDVQAGKVKEHTTMDSIAQKAGDFLGGMNKAIGGVADFMVPRISNVVKKNIEGTAIQPTGFERTIGGMPPVMLAKYLYDVSKGNETYTTEMVPAMTEAATYVLPGLGIAGASAGKAIAPLSKLGPTALKYVQPAVASGVAGLMHGFTTPDKKGILDRTVQGLKSGAGAGLTSLALTGAVEGVKKIPQIAQGIGRYIGQRTIRPDVPEGMYFPYRLQGDVEAALSKTGASITPEGMAKSVADRYRDFSWKISEQLKERAGTRIPADAIRDLVTAELKDAGLVASDISLQSPEVTKAIGTISNAIYRNSQMTGNINISPQRVQEIVSKGAKKIIDQADEAIAATKGLDYGIKAPQALSEISNLEKVADKSQTALDKLRDAWRSGAINQTEYRAKSAPLRQTLERLSVKIKDIQNALPETVFNKPPSMKFDPSKIVPKTPTMIPQESLTKIEQTINPEDLFKTKVNLDARINELNGWARKGAATPAMSEEIKALKIARTAIKNALDKYAPDVSYMTEMQSRLHDIQGGLYDQVFNRGQGLGGTLGNIPGLNLIPGVLGPAQTALAKVLYNAGVVGEDALTNPQVKAFINKLAGAVQGKIISGNESATMKRSNAPEMSEEEANAAIQQLLGE